MKVRQIAWVAALLAVVVLIGIMAGRIYERKHSATSPAFFPGLASTTSPVISISDKDQCATVFNDNGVWFVSRTRDIPPEGEGMAGSSSATAEAVPVYRQYPADSSMVEAALRTLGNMTKSYLVSTNRGKQAVYEADSVAGTVVEIRDQAGGSIGSIVIGKSGPEMNMNYVRVKGSDSVFAVSGNIRDVLLAADLSWRDRTIMSFDRADAVRLTIENRGAGVVLERRPDSTATWALSAPRRAGAKPAEVARMLGILSNLTAMSWEEDTTFDAEDMGLEPAGMMIAVQLGNGDTKILSVGNRKSLGSKSGCFWAKTTNSNAVFLVEESVIYDLDRKAEDLEENS